MPNKKKKYLISAYWGVVFILFLLNFTANPFKICDPYEFAYFDRPGELYVITRLDKSAREGFFSDGALAGHTQLYTEKKDSLETSSYLALLNKRYNSYINNEPISGEYSFTYKSQSAGQVMMYSLIQKILPFNNGINLKIFRVINAVLLALCFLLFLKWVFRNYGFLTSIITFGLIFLSPWIIKFGHNLWWAFWSFYIPFLTMLLVYEKNYPNTKKFSPAKIFLFMYFAVFLKCFFTGFEFISATLMAAFSPIVYYLILEKETFKKTVITFVKNSIAALMGVITAMVILILQIKVKEGFFMNGINHIINSYLIRTTLDPAKEIPMSTGEILKQYIFEGYPFPLHTLIGIKLSFATLLTVILIFSMLILYLSKDRHKIIALLAATLFSVLAPLSWFLIFKEHAATHPFLNYVVWYIPFLLYGFIIIGLGISLIIKPIINKINKQSI